MFSTRYVLIWTKGRSVICGKAAGGSHLNSLPENEEIIWGLSGIAPDRARPPFFGVPQSPAVHAAGRFHLGRKCRALFLLLQLKRLLVVFKGMFSFDLFVQAVVFPFVSFENTFRSLGRCLPVFCLYVYLLAAAFLWE